MNALVSIIIPVYNTEKYLDRCFNSIINQTYKNLEIIFINDGSTDNSLSKLENYKNNYKNVIVINQENKGQSVARNIGLQKMTGEYFMFVDSDDYIHHDTIYNLLFAIVKNKKEIAICHLTKIYKDKNVELKFNCNENSTNVDIIREGLIKNIIQSPCAKLYQKKIKDDIVFPPNKIYEDTFVMLKVVAKYNLVYVDTYGYYYDLTNCNSTTHTNTNVNKLNDYIDALYFNKTLINDVYPELNDCMDYFLYRNYKNICNKCIEHNDYGDYYDVAIKNIKNTKLANVIKYSGRYKDIIVFIMIKYLYFLYYIIVKLIFFIKK